MSENEASSYDEPSASSRGANLRSKAEERVGAIESELTSIASELDARALVHELQVHQIELEMQNEELLRAQAEAQEASQRYQDLFDFAPAGNFVWDQRGRILEVNLAGAAMLGLDRSVVVRKQFGQFVVMEDRPRFAEFCKRVLTTDTKETCEVKLLKDGQPLCVLIEGNAARDRQGQGKLCRAVVIDLSQQNRADELAATNQAQQSEIATQQKRADELAATNQAQQSEIAASKQAEQERENLLTAIEAEQCRLTDIFMRSPAFMVVLRGPEHLVERVNEEYFRLVGRRDILAKPLRGVAGNRGPGVLGDPRLRVPNG